MNDNNINEDRTSQSETISPDALNAREAILGDSSSRDDGYIRSLINWIGISRVSHDALRQFVFTMLADLDVLEKERDSRNEDDSVSAAFNDLRLKLCDINKHPYKNDSWTRAYGIEKVITSYYPAFRVRAEISRRIAEASLAKAPFVKFYKNYFFSGDAPSLEGKDKTTSDIHTLQMLINDLHWFYNQNYIKRRYSRYAIYRVSLVFVLSFIVFLALLKSLPYMGPPAKQKPNTENTSSYLQQELPKGYDNERLS